jgi:RNA polymerase sigma factor (sigma-70 family)
MTSTQAGTVLQHIRRLGPTSRTTQPSDAELLEQFARNRDEGAFADLVRRYAPMVLNVCRTVLRHEQDAEDALQATFIVLARKAKSIRQREALAGWLYEVAHRVAGRAQANATRRREQERKATPMASADSTLDMTLRDLQRVLHEELLRLPDRYRLPLVLCYLQGQSHEEAAGRLGWSKGTFRGRLDRGREHLRRRLTARGIALSAVLCASVVAPRMVAEARVESLIPAVSSGISLRASMIAEGVIRAMFTSKIKIAMGVLLAAGLVTAGVALTQTVSAGDQPGKVPSPPVAKADPLVTRPPTAVAADSTKYAGRVIGPDGKPVSGAKVFLTETGGYHRYPSPVPAAATSGADGRFEFAASKAKFEDRWGVRVAATAPNYGVGWVELEPGASRDDVTIRLAEDDQAITGQIVDLEGKPISKATLTVWQIHAAAGDDVGPWVEAAVGKKGLVLDLERKYFRGYITAPCPTVSTDADGKLRLTGIGRNRLVRAILEGPTIASQHVCIVTRPGKPIEVLYHKGHQEYGEPSQSTTYYGSDFRLVAAPCQPIVGVVRDAETKKPIAGATVRSHSQLIAPSMYRGVDPAAKTTTDAQGRYRLLGMPTGKGYSIAVVPAKDQLYVIRHVDVPPGVGVEPVTVDIELKRGVWIEGKITDKVTGKPLKGSVEYFSRYENPHRTDYPGFDGTLLDGHGVVAGASDDGSFRVVGIPGPGLVCVYYQRDPYLRADERDDEFGIKEQFVEAAPYHIGFTSNFNAIARVEPAKGADSVKCNITIDPGWTFKCNVVGPDEKPLTGARAINLNTDRTWGERMMSADFVGGFNSRRTYDVVVVHPEKGLVGTAQPPKQNGGNVVVKLQPGATATGRLIASDGKPRVNIELVLSFRTKGWKAWHDYLPQTVKTDSDGRFRIKVLATDLEYRLKDSTGEVSFGDGLRSGQMKELGDLRLKNRTEE